MTLGHSLYLKVIHLSHIHQIKLIKWVVQTRVLFPEILRNVTLAGIDFATADLQVNNCYNPSLASLPLPMTSHASVNDTQLEQQREVWNWSLFPHFSNKVNLQFLCETNKDVLCLGINKIFKCRAKIPSLILFHPCSSSSGLSLFCLQGFFRLPFLFLEYSTYWHLHDLLYFL